MAVAALLLCHVWSPPAHADDGTRFVSFSGTDLWRNGQFGHGGLLWSPQGTASDGFLLKAMLSGGRYRYFSGGVGAPVTGSTVSAQVLPGWLFQRERLEVKVFAGPEYAEHHLNPDDPAAGLRGSYGGLRAEASAWFEPTPLTMAAADISASTIGRTYSARAAFGWRVFDRLYVGPEISGFTCTDYGQARIGVHATGFRALGYEWSAAAGFVRDDDDRQGAYLRLGMLTRY